MSDRQEKFGGTKEVADALKFDVKNLEDFMHAHVDGFEALLK